MPLKQVREAYKILREEERQKLSEYIKGRSWVAKPKNPGLKVVSGRSAGKGHDDYTAKGRIAKYDLTNWKWVEMRTGKTAEDFNCVISLNMVEVDPDSGNVHALYDRIGLYIGYKVGSFYYKLEIYTDFELPLCPGDYPQIARLVKEQYDIYCEKKKEAK